MVCAVEMAIVMVASLRRATYNRGSTSRGWLVPPLTADPVQEDKRLCPIKTRKAQRLEPTLWPKYCVGAPSQRKRTSTTIICALTGKDRRRSRKTRSGDICGTNATRTLWRSVDANAGNGRKQSKRFWLDVPGRKLARFAAVPETSTGLSTITATPGVTSGAGCVGPAIGYSGSRETTHSGCLNSRLTCAAHKSVPVRNWSWQASEGLHRNV